LIARASGDPYSYKVNDQNTLYFPRAAQAASMRPSTRLAEQKSKGKELQRDHYQRTSTARGEMAISSGSPSSPVLGFCVTLVAGRTGEDENLA
jgi:hypothetical protein